MRRRILFFACALAVLLLSAWLSSVGQSADRPATTKSAVRSDDTSDFTLTLNGPATVQVGTFANYQLDTTADRVSWKVISSTGEQPNFFALQSYRGQTPDGKPILDHIAFFSTLKPGLYHLSIAAVRGTQLAHTVFTINVVGTDPKPNPDPSPDPEPDPDPNPIPPPGPRFVLIVRETGDTTPAQAQAVQGLRKYLVDKGHQLRIEDKDIQTPEGATPAWMVPYLTRINQDRIALPAMVVGAFSADGKSITNLKTTTLPSTSKAAVEFVQANGG